MPEKNTNWNNFYYDHETECQITVYVVMHYWGQGLPVQSFKCRLSFIFPLSSGDCVLPSSVSSGHPCHVAWQQDPCSLGKHHRTQQTHTGEKHSNPGCDTYILLQDRRFKLKKNPYSRLSSISNHLFPSISLHFRLCSYSKFQPIGNISFNPLLPFTPFLFIFLFLRRRAQFPKISHQAVIYIRLLCFTFYPV